MTKNQTAYTIEAYEFKTSERLAADIEKAIEICNNLNIPISKSIEFRPSFANNTYGLAYRNTSNCKSGKGGKVEFIVLINERMTESKDVIETAIHELLHTAAPTDSHGGKWKAYAEIVNTHTEYRITKTADRKLSERTKPRRAPNNIEAVCPRCMQKGIYPKRYTTISGMSAYSCPCCRKPMYVELPKSPLKEMTDEERNVFVGRLTGKEILAGFLTYAPYADENLTRVMFFKAIDVVDSFSSYKEVEPLKTVGAFVSKKMLRKILNELYVKLFDGRYDNKINDRVAIVEFSGFFVLTDLYVPVCDYLETKYEQSKIWISSESKV